MWRTYTPRIRPRSTHPVDTQFASPSTLAVELSPQFASPSTLAVELSPQFASFGTLAARENLQRTPQSSASILINSR